MENETIHQQQPNSAVAAPEQTRSGQFYRPDVDIVEKGDELLVMVDMPGVKSDDVDIKFEDHELAILGRVTNGRTAREDFLRREYGIGDYYRTFRIGEQIDPSRISAELTDGVLTLHLPKAESAKPRKIKVATK